MSAQVQGEETARTRRRGPGLPLLAAIIGLLVAAPSVQASFHLMKVREVYPGTANDSYVVLQMLLQNESALGNHSLRLYDASGGTIDTFAFSPGYVAPKASHGNNTILIGDTGVDTTFGVAPDDHTEANLNIPASGGAVCWLDGLPPDCVSWGNFNGSLPNPAGSPASSGGVTAGKALHRSIAPGCPTYLESGDDTNSSVNDFSEKDPLPRNNATVPTETTCPSLPNTTIGSPKPTDPTKSTDATFSFTASPAAGASFECKLDDELEFTACSSPKPYAGLDEGSRTFEVRAVNSAGKDPSPAVYKWRIDLTPPTSTILTQPEDPSPGNSASFTYSSNESGSTFQCSLEPSGEPDDFSACPSTGKTYPDAQHPAPFANGKWVFKVLAADQVGNQGAPDEFEWTVDNSLADKTPPETTLVSTPPDPSESSSASFTYKSNEEGSTFECSLDGASFASCPAAGTTYTGLANGSHSFQVRATDGFGNTDKMPAGYSWQVAVPAPQIGPIPIFTPPAPQPPETTIVAKPRAVTRDRTPTFRFRSSVAGSSYQCKLDGGPFRSCRSPFTTKTLPFGRHAVRVRAIAAGLPDPTPAKARFKITRTASTSSSGRPRS